MALIVVISRTDLIDLIKSTTTGFVTFQMKYGGKVTLNVNYIAVEDKLL